MILDIVIALAILNLLVVAHEFGHYIFAKRNGIEVDEFAIGFGPTLLKKKWNNTLWMIKLFPLGGYNGLKGESEAEPGKGNFVNASKRARLHVLLAGSAMNVIVAIFAFYLAIGLYGGKVAIPLPIPVVGARVVPAGDPYPVVRAVVADSPASKMQVNLPFSIISVNTVKVATPPEVVAAISTAANDTLSLEVKDNEGIKTVTVVRDANKKIGISVDYSALVIDYTDSIWTKLFSGLSHTINTVILTKEMLSVIIAASIRTQDLVPLGYAFAGPVAIVAAVGDVVKNSKQIVGDLANMTGLIGVSLAIFNLLPFPGLDGWHIFLLFYEKAKGRRPNEKLVGIITLVGFISLLVFAALIMVKDVIFFFIK